MSLAIAARVMLEAGATAEQIVAMIERAEEERCSKSRAGNARRQQAFRDRNRVGKDNADNGHNARNGHNAVTPVTETPPESECIYNRARADGNPCSSLRSEQLDNPSLRSGEKIKKAPVESAQTYRDEFETEFWPCWMGNTGHSREKKSSSVEFAKVRRKGHSLETIIAGVGRYAAMKPDWQSWKSPNRWLRDENFLDAPAPEPLARAGPFPQTEKRNSYIAATTELIEEGLTLEPVQLNRSEDAGGTGQRTVDLLAYRTG